MSAEGAAAAVAPPSDAQEEVKKADASTEDESSQDSKTEIVDSKDNGDVASPKDEPEDDKLGDDKDVNEPEPVADVKTGEGEPDSPSDPIKKGENGETHDDDEEEPKKQPNDVQKKKGTKKQESEVEDEEEEEEEEDEEGDDVEEKEKKKVPKKTSSKDGEDDKDEEVDDEEEEEGGEEEEEEEEEPQPKKKKEPTEPPVPVPAGKGIPLGHIPNVEIAISRFKIEDLKFMHQYLYNQICRTNLIKRNIKKFKGYEFEKDSPEYKTKVEETQKLEPKQLRMLCEMLDLDKRGSPNDLSVRIVGFLLLPKNSSPHSRGAVKERSTDHSAAAGGRPRRSAAVKIHNRGYSDEEYETDPETKVRGPKVTRDDSADSDGSYNPSGSGQDPDSDFDPNTGEGGGPGRKRRTPGRRPGKPGKRGRPKKGGRSSKVATKRGRGRRPAQSDSEEETESESGSDQGSESDNQDSDPLMQEPPAKRGRGAVSGRGRKPGVAAKNSKSPVAVKRKAPPSPVKKKPGPASQTKGKSGKSSAGKKRKQSSSEEDESGSEEEGSEEEEEGSSEEGSEEDQPLTSQPAAKKGKHPPTDEEIKKYVKQILEGANLEEITMKTVCKQVYSHYPDFDLAHKKDFIKATVKSLISS